MNKDGPVVIIEDDLDDQDLLKEVFIALKYKNEIIFFADGEAALDFLNKTEVVPFLILSDINLPKVDGFELRNKIHTNEKLHLKCIPYLFFSTAANKKYVVDAYSMSVQGFFLKPNNYDKWENRIRKIMEYWQECIAPNEFEQQ
jgi:CheY-like chemotaxis protein